MLDELLANLNFWYAKRTIKLDKHYQFMLDMSDDRAIAVRILKRYPGVIVEYTNIQMSTDNQMGYDISIVANPNLCNVESNRFKKFTTNIFRSIITNSVEYAKENHENRNIDSFQSDAERTIHEEVASVSEERVPERKPREKTVRRNKAIHSEIQQSATDSSIGNQS